jgi:hypothetical protein
MVRLIGWSKWTFVVSSAAPHELLGQAARIFG